MDFHHFALQVGLAVVGTAAFVIGYRWQRAVHFSQRRYYAKLLQAFAMVGAAFSYRLVLEPQWDRVALFWRLIPLALLLCGAWLVGQARKSKSVHIDPAVDS